jgi:hypothetical protein
MAKHIGKPHFSIAFDLMCIFLMMSYTHYYTTASNNKVVIATSTFRFGNGNLSIGSGAYYGLLLGAFDCHSLWKLVI